MCQPTKGNSKNGQIQMSWWLIVELSQEMSAQHFTHDYWYYVKRSATIVYMPQHASLASCKQREHHYRGWRAWKTQTQPKLFHHPLAARYLPPKTDFGALQCHLHYSEYQWCVGVLLCQTVLLWGIIVKLRAFWQRKTAFEHHWTSP